MKKIKVDEAILSDNDRDSLKNELLFQKYNLPVLNIMSSPGAGKTSLIEETIIKLRPKKIGVIVGDLYTKYDAKRIKKAGATSIQINTFGGCHLIATQIKKAAKKLPLNKLDLLIIENVGNLVCPASFNLGESQKIVLLSVTEGDDKVEKYLPIFKMANVVIISKIDLIKHTNFDIVKIKKMIKRQNPQCQIILLSIKKPKSLQPWLSRLKKLMKVL